MDRIYTLRVRVYLCVRGSLLVGTSSRPRSYRSKVERVVVDEDTVLGDDSLHRSVQLLLEEECVRVDLKVADDVTSASTLDYAISSSSVECVRVHGELDLERHQAQWEEFLVWHKNTEDTRVNWQAERDLVRHIASRVDNDSLVGIIERQLICERYYVRKSTILNFC